MAPHACEGPIGGIATLHVDAAMPNFLVQEICSGPVPSQKEKVWEEWLGFPAMRMVNGRFPLPDKPGLGFDLDEEVIKKYPFDRLAPHGAPVPRRRLRGGVVIVESGRAESGAGDETIRDIAGRVRECQTLAARYN